MAWPTAGTAAILYEGERGALLPITVILAVKVTGEAGLALWDRALVRVWLCRGAVKPPVFRFLIACTDSVEDQHAAASFI
jgi:hypothetical protein